LNLIQKWEHNRNMKALKMVCSDWVKGQGHKTQSHLKGEKWIPLSNFLVFRQVLNC